MRAARQGLVGLVGLVATTAMALVMGCQGPMSMFDPASGGTRRIAHLTWFMIVLSVAVFAIVLGILALAIVRNRRRDATSVDFAPGSIAFIIIGGAVLPAAILTVVFVVSLRAMGRFPLSEPYVSAFTITGHQWWWGVTYDDSIPSIPINSANELHVPVGEAVRVSLVSADVIHSFWIPRLQGKIDAIPGDTTELRMLVERPGMYRGQCAEYCGLQHANMTFTIIAESPAQFRAWLAAQQAPARIPPVTDSLAVAGKQVFEHAPCVACHAVRGTLAQGQVGPDLTHVGSRLTLAAGVLPNTLGGMEGWITDAQSLKPGSGMPSFRQFDGRQLRAMASYLESLK